jgi:hypothetical protein
VELLVPPPARSEFEGERMLNKRQIETLRLLERSPHCGDGWRAVSEALWPLYEEFDLTELIELRPETKHVRFSEKGLVIAKYAI